jgi:hypothetical protein
MYVFNINMNFWLTHYTRSNPELLVKHISQPERPLLLMPFHICQRLFVHVIANISPDDWRLEKSLGK